MRQTKGPLITGDFATGMRQIHAPVITGDFATGLRNPAGMAHSDPREPQSRGLLLSRSRT